ncbi:ATP-binding protein [Streptomyces brasiliensis]|uniref:Histidine kinase/HSP90-like ATPase domain-containing protein n=1 Tax=Streptomyces brasiliensis TaxID=1954 RepID=A0A917NYG7_9ACTN|nr:ATP-binding protein [Streptomyces brasiliensis]GGJ41647.1 hypothetical protein GCM10010121_060830 [Streptomyces brasiliensis]
MRTPLGSGDDPFEERELEIASGTELLLSSHGPAGPSPRAVPGAEPARPLPRRRPPGPTAPDDGQSLLRARTRRLDPQNVATLRLPHENAAVGVARSWTRDQLTRWRLDHLDFNTTLVVSELVTNAIRYATGPMRLRLVRDRRLTCEVYDTSSAAPHPRHPTISDQGGRGLRIVAELTTSIGTRYTPAGEIVRAELGV